MGHDIAPTGEIKTVLDLGTGEGRIAEEGQGLRGEVEYPGHTYETLLKLKEENIKLEIEDFLETINHFLTIRTRDRLSFF